MKPGRTGLSRIVAATRYSMRGLKACWSNEAAFRQDAAIGLLGFTFSFVVARTVEQWLLLNAPLLLLLIVELLNSAVETVVDRIGTERHELSGRAKDIGSAAVFLCLTLIGFTWIAILWNNYAR